MMISCILIAAAAILEDTVGFCNNSYTQKGIHPIKLLSFRCHFHGKYQVHLKLGFDSPGSESYQLKVTEWDK